ncbi:MAG: hypothetical protein QNJ77_14060 [Acidimicrobiia bacterium]|nr:hypothetical protein [Acidimicrobiia bacterium]
MEDTSPAPNLRTKLVFWLLLGVLSVAIAEVSVGSAPMAFVNPIEGVFLVTFYGSHLLVLAWLTFRRGWPTRHALWFAGVLFGLYEFYITKVLWVPPWGDVITIGYLDVVAFVVLAFFWHPFMAFILPLAAAETIGTTTRWTRDQLPGWLTTPNRRSLVFGGIAAAVTHGMLTGSLALLSTLSAGIAVVLSARWWRRRSGSHNWSLRQLLPSDRQGKAIAVLLAAQYLVFIPLWNPEKMPPFAGHVVVWLLYGGFGFLLGAALQHSCRTAPRVARPAAATRSRRQVVALASGAIFFTLLGSLAPAELGFIPVWLVAIVIGLRTAAGSIRSVLRGADQDTVSEETLPVVRDADREHRS